jgi:hypothetical protein
MQTFERKANMILAALSVSHMPPGCGRNRPT